MLKRQLEESPASIGGAVEFEDEGNGEVEDDGGDGLGEEEGVEDDDVSKPEPPMVKLRIVVADDPPDDTDVEYELTDEILEVVNKARRFGSYYYFFLMAAWGAYIACYTYYLEDRMKFGNTNDDVTLADDALSVSTYATIMYSVSTIIASPCMGGYCNFIGRRPVILLGAASTAFTFFLWSYVTTPIWYILAGLITGFLDGSTIAIHSIMVDATAMIPAAKLGDKNDPILNRIIYWLSRPRNYDTSKPDVGLELRVSLVALWAYAILGLIFGDIVGDMFSAYFGVAWGMRSAAIIMVIAFVFSFFQLPESLLESQRRPLNVGVIWSSSVDGILSFERIYNQRIILLYAIIYMIVSSVM